MNALLEVLLANTLFVVPIAVVARLCAQRGVRPAIVHVLWLIVLVKLVTPPVARIPVHVDWSALDTGPAEERLFDETGSAQPVPVESVARTGEVPTEGRALDGSALPTTISAEADPGHVPTVAAPAPLPRTDAVDPAHEESSSSALAGDAGDAVAARALAVARKAFPALWLIGAAFVLLRALLEHRRFARRVARFPRASWDLRQEVAREARRLGLRRVPEVRVTAGVLSPMVWSPLWRPLLILPEPLIDRLSADERRTLILHELAHVRRHDHRVRYLELLVRIVHWCNPLAWWAIQELRAAEEECCDVWVTSAFHDSARPYSAALLAAAEFLSTDPRRGPATSTGAGPVLELKRRLTMIFRRRTERSLGLAGRAALVLVGSLALPVLPGLAQEAPVAETAGADAIDRWLALDSIPETADASAATHDDPSPREVAAAIDLAVKLLLENGKTEEAAILIQVAETAATAPRATTARSISRQTNVATGTSPRIEPSHTVRAGESLTTIALRYYDDPARVADIIAANDLGPQAIIRPGQRLILPRRVGERRVFPGSGSSVGTAGTSRAPAAGARGWSGTGGGAGGWNGPGADAVETAPEPGRIPKSPGTRGGASSGGGRSGVGIAPDAVSGANEVGAWSGGGRSGVNVAPRADAVGVAGTHRTTTVGSTGTSADIEALRAELKRLAEQIQRLSEELDRQAPGQRSNHGGR